MSAGLTEPAGAAPSAVGSASGTVTMAPAGTLPLRVESAPLAGVTKTPVGVCADPSASQQPLRSPVGTVVTKVAPVNALPQPGGGGSGGSRLPAPQIVAVKTPNTTTIQLPANLQLPPGKWIAPPGLLGRPGRRRGPRWLLLAGRKEPRNSVVILTLRAVL